MAAYPVRLDYQGWLVPSTEDGWFNATAIAEHFGKRLDFWLKTKDTQAYIEAVIRHSNTSKRSDLIRTKRGNNGGTWFHPRLVVAFSRWLNPDFAVWCDVQIEGLLKGQHPHYDWKRQRHEATASFKVMSDALKLVREEQGKVTASHHYINEARLINGVLSGQFSALDRERLSDSDLNLLAGLEVRNSVLLGRGLSYPERKLLLKQYAVDLRQPPVEAIA